MLTEVEKSEELKKCEMRRVQRLERMNGFINLGRTVLAFTLSD